MLESSSFSSLPLVCSIKEVWHLFQGAATVDGLDNDTTSDCLATVKAALNEMGFSVQIKANKQFKTARGTNLLIGTIAFFPNKYGGTYQYGTPLEGSDGGQRVVAWQKKNEAKKDRPSNQ